jgi:hypothetical protein
MIPIKSIMTAFTAVLVLGSAFAAEDDASKLKQQINTELQKATETVLDKKASAKVDDLLFGGGGYQASLDRLGAKASLPEQQAALAEAEWLQSNEVHVRKLLFWLQAKGKIVD